eukprot:3792634-Prymnesium_polylepis.1
MHAGQSECLRAELEQERRASSCFEYFRVPQRRYYNTRRPTWKPGTATVRWLAVRRQCAAECPAPRTGRRAREAACGPPRRPRSAPQPTSDDAEPRSA